jgi:competence protein ComEC
VNKFHQFIADNLLCAVTCAFAVGIVLASILPGQPLQISCLILTGVLTFFFSRHHWKKSATAMVLLFFTSLGILFGSDCYKPPVDPSHIYHRVEAKKEAVIIGILTSLHGYDGQMTRAEIDCDSIRFKDTKDFVPTAGRISLGLKGIWPKNSMPGDRIVIRADVNRPHSLRTAGSFDYVRFLAEKDIWITGLIDSPLFILKIDAVQSLPHTLRYMAERARIYIGSVFDNTLDPQISGLYKAVVIGEWSGIDPDVLEQFRGSGCMHILSIICTNHIYCV